ncbi:MAG TPA: hypothetical protein VIH90_03870 [Candidatus Saccharimonadales bacterium]
MSTERIASTLSSLGYDELLDRIQADIRSSNALTNGSSDGLINSFDRHQSGKRSDGVGPLNLGTDGVQAINVAETYANHGIPMANKRRTTEQPQKLHVLVDLGDRYFGSTGVNSLMTLARMTTAMTTVAAIEAPSRLFISATGKEKDPLEIDDLNFGTFPLASMGDFDRLLEGEFVVPEEDEPSALATGIDHMAGSSINPRNDVCLVVSDLISGAKEKAKEGKSKKRKGELALPEFTFDWESGLSGLQTIMDDRLFVVRLTSPALTRLDYAGEYTDGSRVYQLDSADYLDAAADYAIRGTAKAKRITEILEMTRSLELSSTDKIPLVTLSDFMFGKPAGAF